MPRAARFCPAGLPAHIIQRGNKRQAIFTSDDDLAAYAHWLSEFEGRFKNSIVQEDRYFLICPCGRIGTLTEAPATGGA